MLFFVKSQAVTVADYLKELPSPRREVIEAVRETILARLPAGYEETMNWGMISYEVPLDRFPKTYNKQPLMYAALSAQKRHYALHLMGLYMNDDAEARLRADFERAGKTLDMGKACVRFKKIEDLPLDVVGREIASVELDDFIALYERTRGAR